METDAVGRQNYDDAQGVHARVTFYPNDIADSAIQTVHFRNTYAHAGILTLVKQDSFSRPGMANVAFTLERQDDTAVKLYQKQGTAEYSLLSSSTNRDYDAIDGDTIRTGANGGIFLQLPAGSDTLKEQTTKGCEEISGIDLTVGDDGAVTSATAYDGSGNAADDVLGGRRNVASCGQQYCKAIDYADGAEGPGQHADAEPEPVRSAFAAAKRRTDSLTGTLSVSVAAGCPCHRTDAAEDGRRAGERRPPDAVRGAFGRGACSDPADR